MDNQHSLTADEIALINDIKALAEQVGQTVASVEALDGVDRRWAAIAKTDLEMALAAIQAIVQPTTS